MTHLLVASLLPAVPARLVLRNPLEPERMNRINQHSRLSSPYLAGSRIGRPLWTRRILASYLHILMN